MWSTLGPWLASGGGVGIAGAVSWIVWRLHMDAVRAHDQRAADWRERALAESARADAERVRADTREAQLGMVLGRASERV